MQRFMRLRTEMLELLKILLIYAVSKPELEDIVCFLRVCPEVIRISMNFR